MKRLLLASAILAGTLTACGGGVYGYYSPVAPPPLRREVVIASPGPGFVWTAGYWSYAGRDYVWVPGAWVRPPRARAVWVAPRWERAGGRWGFRGGHWR